MASFDDLPADQKAVLSMVLKQGRNFDQIAALTGLDRAGVRQRALEGFDALGPETTLEPLKRALITDYLLGQLPDAVAQNVASSLASSPPERAWARIIAAEISPLSTTGLPDIPAAGARPAAGTPATAEPAPELADPPRSTLGAGQSRRGTPPARRAPDAAPRAAGAAASSGGDGGAPRSSRRGGAILIGIITIVVVVVVIVLVVSGGSSKKSGSNTAKVSTTPTPTSSTASGTSTSAIKALHTIDLVSPSKSKTIKGGADVVKDNGVLGLVILAEGLAANTNNAYGVWLYNSSTQKSDFLGFYGKKVAASGKTAGVLEAEVKLPAGATAYNELLLTLETQQKPKAPSSDVVLEGSFAE